MLSMYQQTISSPITINGIGLHSGKKSIITILPGKADQGIIFKRIDLKENNLVHANYKNVSSAKLCTTLENNHGTKVSTVEHLLAAFYVTGIDNVTVEINNEEVPIMDGSARDFLNILKKNETVILTGQKRKYLKVLEKFELIDGNRKISIEPDESFKVDFQLNYENQIIGQQRNLIDFQNDNINEVVESRTFCLFEDIEKIKKFGLAKGGSLDNAVVVDKNKVLNKNGLRNEKEFVNHKILDLAGDFLLSGFRILGKVKCYQGGHELTNMFLRKFLNSKSSYTSIQLTDIEISKKINAEHLIKLAASA